MFLHMFFFVRPHLFEIIYHDIFPVLVYFRFYLAAPNLRTSIFCLAFNTSNIFWGGFLTLVLFTSTGVLSDIVLLSVRPSVLESIAAPRIALYCSLLSYLPVVLYNFLMSPKHICSYKALILNYWYTPMVTILCFSCSGSNIPLGAIYFYSKYSMEIIVTINLVNALDFSHCVARAVLPYF